MAVSFKLNDRDVSVDTAPDTPLLWVLRDHLAMTGTKFGCGAAICGACTVHVDGFPQRSCVTPLETLEGTSVTTIEGLSSEVGEAVKAAWLEIQVPQCGYCQPGQIMSAAGLLAENKAPTDADIDGAMAGNLCRCATYDRVRKAIKSAAAKLEG